MRMSLALAVAVAPALAGPAAAQTAAEPDVQVPAISEWTDDDLYANGWSAERLLDAEVYGLNGASPNCWATRST